MHTEGYWGIQILGDYADLLTKEKKFKGLTVMIMHYCGLEDAEVVNLPPFGSWGYCLNINRTDNETIMKVVQQYLMMRPCELCGSQNG